MKEILFGIVLILIVWFIAPRTWLVALMWQSMGQSLDFHVSMYSDLAQVVRLILISIPFVIAIIFDLRQMGKRADGVAKIIKDSVKKAALRQYED